MQRLDDEDSYMKAQTKSWWSFFPMAESVQHHILQLVLQGGLVSASPVEHLLLSFKKSTAKWKHPSKDLFNSVSTPVS